MTHLDGNELDQLWVFGDPAASESRLRTAADKAQGVAADELRTQIARSLGLQGAFAEALTLLDGISTDDAIVQQRIALEHGRILNSAGEISPAISQFQEAYRLNADAYLTLDAIHMLAITDLAEYRQWFERGLELAQHAHDPRIQRWEGSLRNNFAWNLADEGNLQEALQQFRHAESWFRQHGTHRQIEMAKSYVAEITNRLASADE